jgi:hypothetical protein
MSSLLHLLLPVFPQLTFIRLAPDPSLYGIIFVGAGREQYKKPYNLTLNGAGYPLCKPFEDPLNMYEMESPSS